MGNRGSAFLFVASCAGLFSRVYPLSHLLGLVSRRRISARATRASIPPVPTAITRLSDAVCVIKRCRKSGAEDSTGEGAADTRGAIGKYKESTAES